MVYVGVGGGGGISQKRIDGERAKPRGTHKCVACCVACAWSARVQGIGKFAGQELHCRPSQLFVQKVFLPHLCEHCNVRIVPSDVIAAKVRCRDGCEAGIWCLDCRNTRSVKQRGQQQKSEHIE